MYFFDSKMDPETEYHSPNHIVKPKITTDFSLPNDYFENKHNQSNQVNFDSPKALSMGKKSPKPTQHTAHQSVDTQSVRKVILTTKDF